MPAGSRETCRNTHGRVVHHGFPQLLIAAEIKDVAISRYDFLNHSGPRDFIHGLWQQLFLETVQANAQILRGKLWRASSRDTAL
ncbi:hypothetical protein Nham_0763 [Nitrobacter hamburgensis X14]|uniref:Uncharacterized protein n=1 Tax=Nitrobacter hamburgensis (strain DSM 10229 / NCIMB 13809 / X14) TaxID=323097 RepID=Q1QQ53_NITHX|nr:hypothetical protein Nham_0763 [Nitrobacter hamburgensis X14]